MARNRPRPASPEPRAARAPTTVALRPPAVRAGARAAIRLRLRIDCVTAEGDGLATVDGRSIAVDGTLPGELVDVELDGPTTRFARLVRVLEPSPHRVVPRCGHVPECGGCTWQHVAYGEQLELKRRLVVDLLRAVMGPDLPPVAPVIGTTGTCLDDDGAPWGFRNKTHFVLGAGPRGRGLVLGHYRRRSREVVPVVECPVHAESGNHTAFAIRDVLVGLGIPGTNDPPRGLARHLVVRVSAATSERAATLVVTRAGDRRLKAATARVIDGPHAPSALHLNVHSGRSPYLFGPLTRHLAGRTHLREDIAGVSFLISPTSFFQTNVDAARRLVEVVAAAVGVSQSRDVLDLYGGAGLFALPLARRGFRVVAVEENDDAVRDGEASRELNHVDARSCRFLRARVEEFVAGQVAARAWRGFSPATVVIDPPRDGCAPGVLERILARWRPRRLIYVSCNPRALARDLALLRSRGWIGGDSARCRVTSVQPVDMFPHTPHVETVLTLDAS